MCIQVVHIRTKHVLAKRGEYASAYGAELRSAFLPSSAVQTPRCARPFIGRAKRGHVKRECELRIADAVRLELGAPKVTASRRPALISKKKG